MQSLLSRRRLLRLIGAGALVYPGAASLFGQQPPATGAAQEAGRGRGGGAAPLDPFTVPVKPFNPVDYRSTVSLVRGENRRKNIYDSLMAIDNEIRPALKRKKYVLIKVNLTSVTVQAASTHPDTLRGILDYLGPRFKGPIMIAEAASNDTMVAFDNFKYNELVSEFKSQKVSLNDFNLEGKYVVAQTIDSDVHITPCRIAARLTDPDAFIICAAIPKTHDSMIITGAVKNMAMGAPLRSPAKETPAWSDKRRLHVRGYQQHTLNMMTVSQKIGPYWGLAVLDGYEGMEGAGPIRGELVPHRIALASRDFVAVDRVATETMGIDPNLIGHLQYCAAVGLGNFDSSKIDVRGETIAAVKRTYKTHPNWDMQIKWKDALTPAAPAAPAANPVKKAG
jgi:uncharacterized protein (DUF362 family)